MNYWVFWIIVVIVVTLVFIMLFNLYLQLKTRKLLQSIDNSVKRHAPVIAIPLQRYKIDVFAYFDTMFRKGYVFEKLDSHRRVLVFKLKKKAHGSQDDPEVL